MDLSTVLVFLAGFIVGAVITFLVVVYLIGWAHEEGLINVDPALQ